MRDREDRGFKTVKAESRARQDIAESMKISPSANGTDDNSKVQYQEKREEKRDKSKKRSTQKMGKDD